jgi:hypothetical protein
MSDKKEYRVLNPVSFMGSRFERGEVIAMTEADAHNIGSDYVVLATAVSAPADVTEPSVTPEGEYEPETTPAVSAPAPKRGRRGRAG